MEGNSNILVYFRSASLNFYICCCLCVKPFCNSLSD